MKEAYLAIVQGVLDDTPKHVLLNNIVSSYFIDYEDADEFYSLLIKLVRKTREEERKEL